MTKRIQWNTKLVAAEMLKENCILISEYKNADTPIEYEFEGKRYSVLWQHWLRKIRPVRVHLPSKPRKQQTKWNNKLVKELLAKENCELISEYKNMKKRLKYRFNNLIYSTTLHEWIYYNSRPHLKMNSSEIPFHKFLNDCEVEFEMQKSFKDLLSDSNRVLRFDFYIPEYNVLVEIDGIEHFRDKNSILKDQQKEEYCIKNNIKLFRFKTSSTFEEYLKVFDDPATLINKFYR